MNVRDAAAAESGTSLVDRLVHALLYEGYILYPYRASAVKNQQRFNFGGLYPPAWTQGQSGSDASAVQTECLLTVEDGAALDVRVRFLQLSSRTVGQYDVPWTERSTLSAVDCRPVESLEVEGRIYQTWQEAEERDVTVRGLHSQDLADRPYRESFTFAASYHCEPLRRANGDIVGLLTRTQETLEGTLEISATQVEPRLYRVRVGVANQTPFSAGATADRDAVLLRTLASTHTVLEVREGQFVSLLDPPAEFSEAAAGCRNVGTWPVLIGAGGTCRTMLSSPIILYDYPQIAPESPGDLFDGTEIDEILMLRIMTLTEQEKREMRAVDDRAREILERTEQLPEEQLLKLHGALRGLRPAAEVAR